MNDQEIINRGAEAEQFKRYIEENGYFNSIVAIARVLISHNIASLKPDEQMKFTILKSQEIAIDDLLSIIESDIIEGQKAIDRVQSGTRDKDSYGKGDIL